MIWLIVLGILLIIGLVTGAGKIKVRVLWENLEGSVTFQYLFFRKKFPLKKSDSKSGKEQEIEHQAEKSGKPRNGSFSLESIKTIPEFFPAVRKFLEFFDRYGRVTRLNFSGELGTGDPYYTGLSYGMAQSIGQLIKSLVPPVEFNLSPNFEEEIYHFTAQGKGEIRLFRLLLVLFVTFIYLPKKQVWNLVRSS